MYRRFECFSVHGLIYNEVNDRRIGRAAPIELGDPENEATHLAEVFSRRTYYNSNMHTVILAVHEEDNGVDKAVEFLTTLPGDIGVVVVHSRKDIDVIGSDGGRVSIDHEEFEIPDAFVEAVDALSTAGIEVTQEIRVGDPAEQLVEAAETHDASQLVVSTRKRSPVGKAMFGSRTLDLINESPIPVTVITTSRP